MFPKTGYTYLKAQGKELPFFFFFLQRVVFKAVYWEHFKGVK